MGLFGNVSKRFRDTVDETIAQKKAESAARKKLSKIDSENKISAKAKSYTKKGLSVDEARTLAKADLGKEKNAARAKKLTEAMKGVESLGSSMGSMGDFGTVPTTQKKKTTRKSPSKPSLEKSININIGGQKTTTRKSKRGKTSSNEPDYMSIFRN